MILSENLSRKTNAATIIAKSLGYTPAEQESPEKIIKTALALKPELNDEQKTHLQELMRLAESIGIEVNDSEEISDEELDSMVNDVEDWHHVISAYDDHELSLVDDETGEEVSDVNESTELNEVLSRAERIRAKARFARTKTKREAKVKLALKKRSDTKTLNKRARRLAINMLKTKLTKKSPENMSVTDKERVEKLLSKRKALIDRLSMKLVPRIKKIEKERLSHRIFTK